MRKIIAITILIVCFGVVVSFDGGIDPVPIPDPNSMQISDMQPVTQWELTKAYYRRVKMPDGSKVELKSFNSLTDKQWLQKANNSYKLKLESEKKPEICPCCGRPM